MYRTLGTRGRGFGVPSGPYAGKERTVVFAKLAPGSKQRLVEALGGTRALAPLLRSTHARTSYLAPGAVLLVVTLFVLVRAGWPAEEPVGFAAAYALVFVALAVIAAVRGRAIAYEGTVVAAGTYLFPLDVIDVRNDGTLHLLPIGGLREAAVDEAPGRPALVLTFKDGTARRFGVGSAREAEAAYAALEAAQDKLERLTYGTDMADAVNLDPFFEVRVDDTWTAVSAQGTDDARSRAPSSEIGLYAAAALGGLAVFAARNALARKAHAAARARMDAQIAGLQAKLAQQALDQSDEARREKQDEEHVAERADWEKTGAIGLDAYEAHAPNAEMGQLVADLVKPAGGAAAGLDVSFHAKDEACPKGASCAPIDDAPLVPLEQRFVAAFAQVLSETLPRAALPVRLVRVPTAGPAAAGQLRIDMTLTPSAGGGQAMAMVFDVSLAAPSHAPKTFRLTMPPPAAPLTRPRDRSVFTFGPHPTDAQLVYARGLDRVYDEVYGLFFKGAPRVPMVDTSAVDVQKTFGGP